MIIAANFKANMTRATSKEYIEKVNNFSQSLSQDIYIFPPATALDTFDTNINVGSQNAYSAQNGAFTGETALEQLEEFGIDTILIGHSERRHVLKETQEDIARKFAFYKEKNFKIIYCVGETLEQRDKNETKSIIETQIREGLAKTTVSDLINIVIAYEPVWAIGTGQTASPEQAQEIHGFIRQLIADLYNNESANNLRIIYGGSVNPKNAAEIISQPDIDGCLPGGASLDPESFAKIIKA